MKKRVLILFAHPALEKSRVNKVLIQGLDTLENVTFHDLYEAYPDLEIHVDSEQKLLLDHDVICFMHPLYWYSTPAILKEWQDLVLVHGWAYGSQGNKLAGKSFQSIITTGGPQRAYENPDPNRFSIIELLAPIVQTARLCKMNFLTPFLVQGTHGITDEQINSEKERLNLFLQNLINS